MNRMVVKSRVGSDGVLHLDLPHAAAHLRLGAEDAEREVLVTVESARPTMTQDQWRAWVESMAGSWQGEFERMPQGDYEQREPLP